MQPKLVLPNLYSLSIRQAVNVFILVDGKNIALIDTGFPDSGSLILDAVKSLGFAAEAVRHIIATHCHNDHAGSLAELQESTGAISYMHEMDADLIRTGRTMRVCSPAPTSLGQEFYSKYIKDVPFESFDVLPVQIDRIIADSDIIDFAGGIEVVFAPGHCAGQVALLWKAHGGVLFAADIAPNADGLILSPVYEDMALGLATLNRVSQLDFEHACFGHGSAMKGAAAEHFRRK